MSKKINISTSYAIVLRPLLHSWTKRAFTFLVVAFFFSLVFFFFLKTLWFVKHSRNVWRYQCLTGFLSALVFSAQS